MAPEYIGAIVCLMFVGVGVLIGYVIWGTEGEYVSSTEGNQDEKD